MKIAIHNREGSFSDRWIAYCKENSITYKEVNCYDSDIIAQLKDCDALMWHHHHGNYRDVLVANPILFSLEQAGVRVFPDFTTTWHFDDKVAQKYLLEAINAPLVPSYVFYDKKTALKWAKKTNYPKVFKLKGGASAENVSLVNNKRAAKKKIDRAFGKGFSQFNRWGNLKERYRQESFKGLIKGIGRLFIPTEFANMGGREKGYVYFQEFIPNNNFDIRVIVIKGKAFALKRMTRENDFRASGSGKIVYDRSAIDIRCLEISFNVNNKVQAQSIAFDFVFDQNNNPLIVEISYGFAVQAYDACPGYWDSDLKWHEGKFNPQIWMIENLIKEIESK